MRIFIVSEGNVNIFGKNEIEQKMKLLMGEDCEIIWDLVEKIPKTEDGKRLYRSSLLWRQL